MKYARDIRNDFFRPKTHKFGFKDLSMKQLEQGPGCLLFTH